MKQVSACVAAAIVLGVVFGLATGCSGDAMEDASTRDGAVPGGWIDARDLQRGGFGRTVFETDDRERLAVHTYRATRFDPSRSPIWFVMHGASRDADRYVAEAAPVAERAGALALAIEFTREAYPSSSDYTLGVQRNARVAMGRSQWLSPEDMLYAVVEDVFDATVQQLGGAQTGYFLFGHSAGAQFVHRLLTFLPEPRVLGAVAANAGWYTLPVAQDPYLHAMPYGLHGAPVSPEERIGLFTMPFVVLVGANDTTTAATDELVRGTPEAEAQGRNRLERGQYYVEVARQEAARLDVDFRWRSHVVPHARHDAGEMIDSAGFYLFGAGADPAVAPCDASASGSASNVVVTEILADPPEGMAGDSNGDGKRDPIEDEFVEIFNSGDEPVCLNGWTLGDNEREIRHAFPLDQPLAPGETLIVFGGGVPTGEFGGARVQWADGQLSLSNAGDVLTLRDAEGRIVQQISWGDCDGAPCAGDHWPGSLGIESSIARSPGPGARWVVTARDGGVRSTPGTISEASNEER